MTSPQLTLRELTYTADGPCVGFSPHVWKTKIDLAILGLDYISQGISFGELAKIEPRITVPILDVKSGGGGEGDVKSVRDSWVIAEYLDDHHSSPKGLLFGASATLKSYAKFLNTWADTVLSVPLRPFIMPRVYDRCDQPSKVHFLKTKHNNDPKAMSDFFTQLDEPQARSNQVAAAIKALKPLETALSAGGPFVGGEEASHADAAVFGWYAFHKRNEPKSAKEIWESDELPGVRAWVGRVLERFVKEDL